MRFNEAVRAALLAAAIFVTVLTLAGCAGQCGTGSGATKEAGTVLEYRIPDDVSYEFISDTTQTMNIQGQSVPIYTSEVLAFSVTPKGTKGGEHALGITIDGLTVIASTPDGDLEADPEGIVGESFDMTLSKLGIEGGLPESDFLEYMIGNEGPKSIITGFSVIFPDLPERPVDVGGTWPVTLELTEQSGDSSVVIKIDAVNTLAGFDVINGLECAEISAVLTGTIEGSGAQNGVEWTMSTEMDGVGSWYFAHEEGILVSDWTEGTADGSITVASPGGEMVIPVTREYTMLVRLVQ